MHHRLKSIDLLRGVVMALMAIDHVRVYAGVPAGGKDPALFFTRWVTHFCVSGFVFFAGVGIFLHARKINSIKALSRYLAIRGLLLVFLELTLIRFCWTFNLNFSQFILAGVIWMIGLCMILMALLVRLPAWVNGCLGIAIIVFQQVFADVPRVFPESVQEHVGLAWNFFYPTGMQGFGHIAILYSIIPWIGVMATGYCFGQVLLLDKQQRRKYCIWIGICVTALFIIIGSYQIVTGPLPEEPMPFIYRLLHQNKYPASQLFLLMTLGPLIFFIPFVENVKGFLGRALVVFGRVPLFYYIIHIPLIHLLALLVNWIRDGVTHQEWYTFAPFYTQQEYPAHWPLGLLYAVYVIVEIFLYLLCRWYMRYKENHPGIRFLRYL